MKGEELKTLLAAAIAAIIAVTLLSAVPTFAGGDPVFAVSVSTGQIAPWGQELVHGAYMNVTTNPSWIENFDYTWGLGPWGGSDSGSSWSAFTFDGDEDNLRYSKGNLSQVPSTLKGLIWSGAGEPRAYYQTNFALYGEVWGMQWLTVRNSAGFPVILNEEMTNGYNQNFWFSSAESYTFTVTHATTSTPEPGGVLGLGTGLTAMAGFAIRRRHK